MENKIKKKWIKDNGEQFNDDDILCINFKTFYNLILNEKHEVAFNYMKKFREETKKLKESIPKNEFTAYVDGIEFELRDFYLNGDHI